MTREEAIKIVQSATVWTDEERDALAMLIPELAESEDEKIIKTLQEYVKNRNWPLNGPTQEEVLAYLEKKKETGIRWFKSDEVKNPDKPYIDKAGMFYTTDGRMCYASEIEKQKEPLPIPDKFSGLKSLMLQYLQSAANRKDDTEIESDTDLWGRKILDYVWKYDEHLERQKEQKPISFNEPYNPDDYEVVIKGNATGLKKKEQKPEWSEEDNKNLGEILGVVYEASCGIYRPFERDTYKRWESWLKSLRPSWKPKGQQLDCLRHMINVSTVGKIDKQLVQDLYEQLKTLM